MTSDATHPLVAHLAESLLLGEALRTVAAIFGRYELRAHWLQGEFHHDLVLHVEGASPRLPGDYLVIATNCNGGLKEVLCFAHEPDRWALWNRRCPDNPEFEGELPDPLAIARTIHWFDPCVLLTPDTRSEMLPEHRRRQRGGGWRSVDDLED